MGEGEWRQGELVKAFSEGRVAGVPAPVERIDTHLSHVFLSQDRAFKLKRAVQLPFVDFSSSQARRAACEAEVMLQPMARALYLGALPIIKEGQGDFRIGGEGEAVDWVVCMRRFEQDQQFDRLASRGALTRQMVEEVVDILARAHGAAPATQSAGHAAHYRKVIDGLHRTEADGAAKLGVQPGSTFLFERLKQGHGRAVRLIEARRARGKVRRGHGDLHLRNICMFEARPMPFDALEFDEALATTDVLYDLAFLLMDLRRIGLGEHANAAMNRYWDVSHEEESALALLPFFMSLRATVRLAVAVEMGALGEAQTYRKLGLELLEPSQARLIAIGGLSGTGKSAIAQALAPLLPGPAGARLLRSDVIRKTALGVGLAEKADEAHYAPQRRADVYLDLADKAAQGVQAGATVIADATFGPCAARKAIVAAAAGAPFSAYWLTAPTRVRLERVARRQGDASDAGIAVAAGQSEPSDLGAEWRRLDADRPVRAIVEEIMHDLAQSS